MPEYDVVLHSHIEAPSREEAEAYGRTLLMGKKGVTLRGVSSADCWHATALPTYPTEIDEIVGKYHGGGHP